VLPESGAVCVLDIECVCRPGEVSASPKGADTDRAVSVDPQPRSPAARGVVINSELPDSQNEIGTEAKVSSIGRGADEVHGGAIHAGRLNSEQVCPGGAGIGVLRVKLKARALRADSEVSPIIE